ncbi:MAG: hypothetical protein ABSA51_05050 [Anaerolineaceae bacterium]
MLKRKPSTSLLIVTSCTLLAMAACTLTTQMPPTAIPAANTDTPVVAPTLVSSPTPEAMTTTPTSTLTPVPQNVPPTIAANGQAVNCRYGPGMDWLTVGALKVGPGVPVYGSNQDQTWWQIDSSWNEGMRCWVSAATTTLSGAYQSLPIIPVPEALVTDVQVTTTAVIHGTCGGPNATNFTGAITTNGPTTVTYHWEIYDTSTSTMLNALETNNLAFAAAGTQSFTTDSYKRDCGTYLTKLVVTSPNSMTGKANWSVVSP